MVISDNRNNSRTLFENKISKEVLDDYNSRTIGDVLKTVTGVSTLKLRKLSIKTSHKWIA